MDTKERETGDTPARHPRRIRVGIRHTALAAKNDLEKPEGVSRGALQKIFEAATH